jgi:drug/metabolite transporter (DMT)-like permease
MPAWIPGNALIALAAAAFWGGGDFCGGMGVKAATRAGDGTTVSALRVVILAHAVSLAAVLTIVALQHGTWPADPRHNPLLGWGLGAGVAAGLSLTAFYLALSRGTMGASAAVSGLLAAAIPAVVSTAIEGAPTALRIAGFTLAAAAIWMIAAGPSPENVDGAGGPSEVRQATFEKYKTMALAMIGGLGFGFYFVALRMDNPLGVFAPMALARIGSLATCLVLLGMAAVRGRGSALQPLAQKQVPSTSSGQAMGHPSRRWLGRSAVKWALGVALLDTGGNLLFLAATRMGRLDVAAVLASLYPASTILLAAWRLHERPTRRQMAGMGVALAAVVMITA